jgi:DNA-binding NtrC family response regulator
VVDDVLSFENRTAVLRSARNRSETADHANETLQDHRRSGHPAVKLHDGPEAKKSVLPIGFGFPQGAGHNEFVYPEPGNSLATGFSEPPREPGPKAPAAEKSSAAEGELAAVAEALVGMPLADVERLVIEATIRACGDSVPKAARVLGVSPSTLYRKRAGWTDQSGNP